MVDTFHRRVLLYHILATYFGEDISRPRCTGMFSIEDLSCCPTMSCISVIRPCPPSYRKQYRASEASTSLTTFAEKEALQCQVPCQ